MAFIDKLPEYHSLLKAKTVQLEATIQNLWAKLDDDEDYEARNHMCDCDYCPYADYVPKPLLSTKEAAEVEDEITELEKEKREAITYTNRLEGYAKMWGVRL